MNKLKVKINPFLFWIPRVLAFVFAVFLGLFALDVFNENKDFWLLFWGFIVHLLPSFVIIAVLALSWKYEFIGGLVFVLLGLAYMIMAYEYPSWVLIVSGPLYLIGILFMFGYTSRKKHEALFHEPKVEEEHHVEVK